jgi:c-di-GMP-binding flagellar brake protein YcgR
MQPQSERRQHQRRKLACPIWMAADDGRELTHSRTVDISDGGMLVPMDAKDAPTRGAWVHVRFSVPRATPSTYLLEDFACDARVVRRKRAGAKRQHVALRFDRPVSLALEV